MTIRNRIKQAKTSVNVSKRNIYPSICAIVAISIMHHAPLLASQSESVTSCAGSFTYRNQRLPETPPSVYHDAVLAVRL